MSLPEAFFKDVPEYYDGMQLDGYTPEQIMYARRKASKKQHNDPKSQKWIMDAVKDFLSDAFGDMFKGWK